MRDTNAKPTCHLAFSSNHEVDLPKKNGNNSCENWDWRLHCRGKFCGCQFNAYEQKELATKDSARNVKMLKTQKRLLPPVDAREIMSPHSITLYKSLTNVELRCLLTNEVLYKHLIRNCSQYSLTQWVQEQRVWTPHPMRASASSPCTNHKRNIHLISQNPEAIIQIRCPKCEMRFILYGENTRSRGGKAISYRAVQLLKRSTAIEQHLWIVACTKLGKWLPSRSVTTTLRWWCLRNGRLIVCTYLRKQAYSTRFALETCGWGAEGLRNASVLSCAYE